MLTEARRSAAVSHDHPEGIKGAQATALAIHHARTGASRGTIRDRIEAMFGYDLRRCIAEIRPHYAFDVFCQGSVPEAILAFLESDSYEGAVRNAISLGGDADTLACICGGIAEAYYDGVPAAFVDLAETTLTADLLEVVRAFRTRFGLG